MSEIISDQRNEKTGPTEVRIVNIDMPFMSMVNFMAKAILAAVPAMLVVVIFIAAIVAFISGIFR